MSLLLLLNPAVTGVNKYYTNANSTGIWGDELNWSTTSNGPQNTTLPSAADFVFIDLTLPLEIDGTQACTSYFQTGAASLNISGTLACSGDFSIQAINNLTGAGTVNVGGSFLFDALAALTNTITFIIDGAAGNQNFSFLGTPVKLIQIKKASGNVVLIGNSGGGAVFDLEVFQGTLDINGKHLNLDGKLDLFAAGTIDATTANSRITCKTTSLLVGTIIAPSVFTLTGGDITTSPIEYDTACSFSHNNGKLVLQNSDHCGWSPTVNLILNDVQINISPTGDLQPIGTFSPIMNVRNDVTFTNSNNINIKIECGGDINGDNSADGSGEIKINGTGDQAINATGKLPGIRINKASGTLTQNVDISLASYITWTKGDVDFVSKGKTTTLAAANNVYSLLTGNIIFYKIIVDKGGSSKYNLLSDLRIKTDFIINNWAGSMDFSGASFIRVGGAVLMGTTDYTGTAGMKLSGTGQNFTPATTWTNTGIIELAEVGAESDLSLTPAPSNMLREDGGLMLREDGDNILREGI